MWLFSNGGTFFHQHFSPLIALVRNEETHLLHSWRCSQSSPHHGEVHPLNKQVICVVYGLGNITLICLHNLGAFERHMATFFSARWFKKIKKFAFILPNWLSINNFFFGTIVYENMTQAHTIEGKYFQYFMFTSHIYFHWIWNQFIPTI